MDEQLPPDGTLRARVTVENVGARAGDEVVQLYVGCVRSRVERSVRELRAFRRVSLAPGVSETIVLEVPVAELAYWDETTRAWIVEETDYRVEVGSSSRDLPLSATLTVIPPLR